MGYIRHDAIVVTAIDKPTAKKARTKAIELGLQVTSIVSSRVNGYASFLVIPDGSKEGWKDSDDGIAARFTWKEWMRSQRNLFCDWAHVNFGGDDKDHSRLEDHNGILGHLDGAQ